MFYLYCVEAFDQVYGLWLGAEGVFESLEFLSNYPHCLASLLPVVLDALDDHLGLMAATLEGWDILRLSMHALPSTASIGASKDPCMRCLWRQLRQTTFTGRFARQGCSRACSTCGRGGSD